MTAKPFRRTFARVRDGFITEIETVETYSLVIEQPFALLDGERAVDVTKVLAQVGDIVDSKGNVAPNHGRTQPLAAHESAYHDRSAQPAHDTVTVAAHVSTGAPPAHNALRKDS